MDADAHVKRAVFRRSSVDVRCWLPAGDLAQKHLSSFFSLIHCPKKKKKHDDFL